MACLHERSSATDLYSILVDNDISAVIAEKDIVNALLSGEISETKLNDDETTYTTNNNVWTHSEIQASVVDNCAPFNYPPGTVKEKAVVMFECVEDIPSGVPNPSEFSVSINKSGSTGNNYKLKKSANENKPLYDAHTTFTFHRVGDIYDQVSDNGYTQGSDAKFKVNFDEADPNVKLQRAMQSKWNTLPNNENFFNAGPVPLTVQEDVVFNKNSVFGLQGFTTPTGSSTLRDALDNSDKIATFNSENRNIYNSKSASMDANGTVSFANYANSYQPNNNNLAVDVLTDDVSVTTDSAGVYKLVQAEANLITSAKGKSDGFASEITQDVSTIADGPLYTIDTTSYNSMAFNATRVSDNNFPNESEDDFFNFITSEKQDNIKEGFKITVKVTSDNGGYEIKKHPHPFVSDINDNNVQGSLTYMKNLVHLDHSINFTEDSIQLTKETTGLDSTLAKISLDYTDGEKLPVGVAQNVGKIYVKPEESSNRITGLTVTGSTVSQVNVFYEDDYNKGLVNHITGDMLTSEYLAASYKKVADTSDGTHAITDSNKAFVSLYSNQYIPDSTQASPTISNSNNVNFSIDKSSTSLSDVNIFKLNVVNDLLIEQKSFYTDYDIGSDTPYSNPIPNISCGGTLTGLDDLNFFTNMNVYDEHRVKLISKGKDKLNLSTTQVLSDCWQLNYSDISREYLTSSSEQAFILSDDHSLMYREQIIQDVFKLANDTSAKDYHYKYTFKYEQQNDSNGGQILPYVLFQVVDTVRDGTPDFNSNNVKTLTINKSLLTREQITGSISKTFNRISPSEHTAFPDGTNYRLEKVVITSSFNISFNPLYSVYNNILLKILNIDQISTFYAVYDNNTNQYVKNHQILLGIRGQGGLHPDIHKFVQNLLNGDSNTGDFERSITGKFNPEDFTPFDGIIESRTGSQWNEMNVDGPVPIDVFFNTGNKLDIRAGNQDRNPVNTTLTILYQPNVNNTAYDNTEVSETTIFDSLSYFMPFVLNPANNLYTLSSFISSAGDLSTKTSINHENNIILNVLDKYNSINPTQWSTSNCSYTKTVGNQYIQILIKKDNNVVVTFNILKTLVFSGDFIVTYIPNDVWTSKKITGVSNTNNSFIEEFQAITYNPAVTNGFSFETNILRGIHIKSSAKYGNGTKIDFDVKKDQVSLDIIFENNDRSYAELSGDLTYQYSQNNEYSCRVVFQNYRGYGKKISGVDEQVYNIIRNPSTVSFNVGQSVKQEFTNPFKGMACFINNLTGQGYIVNLGISFVLEYSILPSGTYDRFYPVTVTGDTVTITIDNPLYDNNPYVSNQTLATVITDPLSIFSAGNRLIRSDRVKLKNSSFSFNEFSVIMTYETEPLQIFKAVGTDLYDGFGDATNNGVNWSQIKTLTQYSEKTSGYQIGLIKVSQRDDKREKSGTSYINALLPRTLFKSIKVVSNTPLPYDYNAIKSSIDVIKSIPYLLPAVGDFLVKPFNYSTHKNINGSDLVISREIGVNDLTFTYLGTLKPVKELYTSAEDTIVPINVPENIIIVKTKAGFYGASSSSTEHTIFHGLTSNILKSSSSTVDNDINNIYISQPVAGKVEINLRQYPSDNGMQDSPAEYTRLFGSDPDDWYVLHYTLETINFFHYESYFFNEFATGIKSTLFTVQDVHAIHPTSNVSTNYRRIDKYEGTEKLKYNNLVGDKTLTLTYNSKKSLFVAGKNVPFSSTTKKYGDYFYDLSVNNVTWVDETLAGLVKFGWTFGNNELLDNFVDDTIQNNKKKWIFIELIPFLKLTNQLDVPLAQILFDGTLTTPKIETRILNLITDDANHENIYPSVNPLVSYPSVNPVVSNHSVNPVVSNPSVNPVVSYS